MNTTQDDGGPAFPFQPQDRQGYPCAEHAPGLSIRDWFAKEGARMHAEGLLALGIQPSSRWDEIAAEGLRFADAMLAARKEAK